MISCTVNASDRFKSGTVTNDPIIFTITPRVTRSPIIGSVRNFTDTPKASESTDDKMTQTTQVQELIPEWSIFGIHLPIFSTEDISLVQEAGGRWLRRDLKWYMVEEVEGERDWNALESLEKELLNAAKAGMDVILILGGTPKWALKNGYSCGAIAPDKLGNFGTFVNEVVMRYKAPPYNIRYWELYNEPDTIGISYLGCWGDTNDDYYGGVYYSDMLKLVYPIFKDADPNSIVLIGGLLLDCDPRSESNWCKYWGHDERPPKFLEGILQNNGGDYFDGVSFHAYDYYDYTDPELGEYLNPLWGNSWNGYLYDGSLGSRIGPVMRYKAEYIEQLLNEYNAPGKILLNTENALICGASLDPPESPGCESGESSIFEQTKAKYLAQAYTVASSNKLKANIWFSLYGWRNSALLNEDQSPRPAYYSYQVARNELANAEFVKEYYNYQNVKVYEFQRSNRKIWVVWSIDGNPHTITLPSAPDEVKDFMGVVKTPSSTFTAKLDPHYLIWYP